MGRDGKEGAGGEVVILVNAKCLAVVRSVAAAVERQTVMRRGEMDAVKKVVANGVERLLVGGGPKERDWGAFDFIFAC